MGTIFQKMVEAWPSPIVARTEVSVFSGGLLNEKTMANSDSLGVGVVGRFRIGRKVVYPVSELIKWLEARSEVIPERSWNGLNLNTMRRPHDE